MGKKEHGGDMRLKCHFSRTSQNPEGHVDQADQGRHLHQRADDGEACLALS